MKRMKRIEYWGYFEHPVANSLEYEQGEMACVDTATGLLRPGTASTTLIPIGYFTGSGTGDGTTKVRVELFREVQLHRWDNDDGGTPVVAGDLMQPCYILDDRTVSGSDGTGTRSTAGRVWAVTSLGVLVEMQTFSAG